jgi:hypothetical protein
MVRKYRTAIRSLALLAGAALAFSIGTAAGQPAAGAEGLWVAGENNVSVFQGQALQHSGEPNPHISFTIKDYFGPLSMVFDRHNNLWIASSGMDDGRFPIVEISRAHVASVKNGKIVKRRVIFPKGIGTPWGGLAFDGAGNLWASSLKDVLKLPAAQIEQKRVPSPSVVLSEPFFLNAPNVRRFDASGNLWVSTAQMWRFAPADRRVSGLPNPSLKVNLPDALSAVDVAFDNSGNMWVAGVGSQSDELEMILADDLGGSGEISPSAAVTITSAAFGPVGSSSCLGGMDFDRSGDLWVSVFGGGGDCEANSQIVEFTPGQLSVGGSLAPSITIGQNSTMTNLFLPGPIRFGPTVK